MISDTLICPTLVCPFSILKTSAWDQYGDLPWLKTAEVQAPALWDLGFGDNRLSVWSIEDDKSNLERIIGALAARRENIENLDYVLIESSSLSEPDIAIEKTNGETPDEDANTRYHFDGIQLAISKILNIANLIKLSPEKERVQSFDVKKYLLKSFERGYFNQGRLKAELLGKLQGAIKPEDGRNSPV